MRQSAARNRTQTAVVSLGFLWLVASSLLLASGGPDTIARFKKLYGNVRDYRSFELLKLNGAHYLLAFWYEDNDPLQFSVNIFRYQDEELQKPIFKVYTGSVAETLRATETFDLMGTGKDQLIFLSDSGEIELLRVLEDTGRDLKLVFENGGSQVTVLPDSREIWIKNKVARNIDVYKWDSESQKFAHIRTIRVLF